MFCAKPDFKPDLGAIVFVVFGDIFISKAFVCDLRDEGRQRSCFYR